MTAVIYLTPGDRIHGRNATLIAQSPHPIWTRLQLLVWHDDRDGTIALDMAGPGEDIGQVDLSATAADRDRRLVVALPEHAAAGANGRRR